MTPRASEPDRVYLLLFSFLRLRENRILGFCFLPPFPLSLMHKWKQNKTKQNKPRTPQRGQGSGGEEIRVILIFKNPSCLGRKIRGSPVRSNEIASLKITGGVCLSVSSWEESPQSGRWRSDLRQVHAGGS